jgi:hypothetical protein
MGVTEHFCDATNQKLNSIVRPVLYTLRLVTVPNCRLDGGFQGGKPWPLALTQSYIFQDCAAFTMGWRIGVTRYSASLLA